MTIETKPELDLEGGITEIALSNARKLKDALGAPVRVELHMDPNGAEWYRTKAFYMDGNTHTFTGLGWGYRGEGPRGLATFCAENEIPLTLERIAQLDNKSKAMVWEWPSRPTQAPRLAHPEDA